MFPGVTVTAVAAPLAVVSALFALVFVLYGIPRGARNEPRMLGVSVLLSAGNVGFVVLFLVFVAQRVNRGIDPPLFTNPFPPPLQPCPECDRPVNPNPFILQTMWATVFVALLWYTASIMVLTAQIRAGRSRRQRAPSSSK